MSARYEREQPEQFLEPYIQQLGLRWKVVPRVEKGADGPSIVSSRKKLEHDIYLS